MSLLKSFVVESVVARIVVSVASIAARVVAGKTLLLIACVLFSSTLQAQKGSFVSVDELRERAFPGQSVEWQTLWVTQQQREVIEAILDHSFRALRVRYWGQGQRTTWIFEEVGKEYPITFGVIVDDHRLVDVVVMEYRESRGGEVRYPFFAQQFQSLGLTDEPLPQLDGDIDGITGATLSVRAMKKVATLALFCHQLTPFSNTLHHERIVSTAAELATED